MLIERFDTAAARSAESLRRGLREFEQVTREADPLAPLDLFGRASDVSSSLMWLHQLQFLTAQGTPTHKPQSTPVCVQQEAAALLGQEWLPEEAQTEEPQVDCLAAEAEDPLFQLLAGELMEEEDLCIDPWSDDFLQLQDEPAATAAGLDLDDWLAVLEDGPAEARQQRSAATAFFPCSGAPLALRLVARGC